MIFAGGSATGPQRARTLLPGLLLCGVIGIAASLVQAAELRWLHRAWVETIALSIIIGLGVRLYVPLGPSWTPGVAFSSKTVLEVAVVLLGASVSFHLLEQGGPLLLLGVGVTVALSLVGSYLIGRLFGLSRNQATLVACGNSICGNSAIAAVAPVIRADSDDVAASIAFTAVLSIVVVVGLPYVAPLLRLSPLAYGVLAGLTVYAVPQVAAATAPLGAIAMQAGALVKLTRVLMLAPAIGGVAALAKAYPNRMAAAPGPTTAEGRGRKLIPWFVIGFLAMLLCRSTGLLTDTVAFRAVQASAVLTSLAMAALGLTVDIRTVMRAGSRVGVTATLSVVLIGLIGIALLHLLGMA